MQNLVTTFLGLQLENPLIVSSSGLTNSAEKIKKIEEAGAGAVILKSLFEEQINFETNQLLQTSDYPEATDYIGTYSRENSVDNYLELIGSASRATNIPVIASINCITDSDWKKFAGEIEEAGADALELNMYLLHTDQKYSSKTIEDKYYSIVKNVKKIVDIPILAKVGYHMTNMVRFTDKLHAAGAAGVTLFNRFYEPDIDIENMRFQAAPILSSPDDIRHSLRWVGIISSRVPTVEISASTGVHKGDGLVKLLLAGAQTVQVCSTLYKNGVEKIQDLLSFLNSWMGQKGFDNIDQFRRKMNISKIKDPAVYERAQFMKYFSSYE